MTVHPVAEQVREPKQKSFATESVYAVKQALFQQNNQLLMMVVFTLAAVVLALCAWTHGVYVASLERAPLYFGIDHETGAIMQLRSEALNVQATDEMLRNQFEGFVTKHFSRIPNLSSDDYKHSLLMLDADLTGPGSKVIQERKDIAEMDNSPLGHEQVRVQPGNMTFEGLEAGCKPGGKPCIATVYFTRKFSQNNVQLRQATSILKLTFFRLPKIRLDPDLISYNPLALVITGLYESEGHGA